MFEYNFNTEIFEVSHKRVVDPKSNSYATHMHTYCEMILFISGDVRYNIDGNIYTPREKDLLFVPKDTYHFLMPNENTVYENYVLSFLPTVYTPEEYIKIFSAPLAVRADKTVYDLFTRLDTYEELYTPLDFKKSATHLIHELLTYCLYLNKEGSLEASNDPIVNEIIQYIEKNIKAPLNADIISHALNLSKSHVQNLFSAKMNIGLKQYIQKKKIFASRNEIEKGRKPVDVSNEYGFLDYSVFYRTYKKVFSTSPKAKNN